MIYLAGNDNIQDGIHSFLISGSLKGSRWTLDQVLSLVWCAVSEANRLEIGCMHNCMDDLLILHRFGLQGRPSKAPVIKSVVWSPPPPGWIKVNTDGAAMGSPGVGGWGLVVVVVSFGTVEH